MPRRFLRLLCSIAAAAATVAAAQAAPSDAWLGWLSPALRDILQRQTTAQREFSSLGIPVVGQTVPEFGYIHPRLVAPPPASPWVQIDLQSPQLIDWIALVPAQVDWQPVGGPAYGFPQRFRIDASDDPEFTTFTPVAVFTDSDFPDPGVAPVPVRASGTIARYVRVTVTKLAIENSQHFFALAEILILSGQRNLAIGRPVRASAAVNIPPRWSTANLVDGRTPLGPPVQRELQPYDGLYAGPSPDSGPLWMRVDLGRALPLQEVRIHPVHARIGADIPGFLFPARFRVEASLDAAFDRPISLLDASATDFPNPGNNPVTVPTPGVTARFVQITLVTPAAPGTRHRFGLSEIEIYSNDINVARAGTPASTPDPSEFSRAWPVSQLTDGYTSYGQLVPLPDWLLGWQRRTALRAQLAAFAARVEILSTAARHRALWAGLALGGALLVISAAWLWRQRSRRARELEEFRTRLARDLHDEIGSNLAGLAVLSESLAETGTTTPAAREDWREVNRIARESTDAMREVLWVIGAREEAGLDLAVQLRHAAARMLAGRTLHWEVLDLPPATAWSAEERRHVFLFFKETLANIVRHAAAKAVRLSAVCREGEFTLVITDDGRGFDLARIGRGLGLTSMRDRARLIGGRCEFVTAPGAGTRVTLRVPVHRRPIRHPAGTTGLSTPHP